MTEHTTGPWELDVVGRENNPNDPRHCQVVALAHGRHVVIVDTLNCSCIFSTDDQEANARLIAAAPDMLAVLKRAQAASRAELIGAEFWNEVDAAVAKATGEAS